MKIIVCVKQVPDTKGGVKFNPDGTLDRGAMLTIMNPDDKAGHGFRGLSGHHDAGNNAGFPVA